MTKKNCRRAVDPLHAVQSHVRHKAINYSRRNATRVKAAALSVADLSQEAMAWLTLYCPRMFVDPNDALIASLSRAAFSNATRRGVRASAHAALQRAAAGKALPDWLVRNEHKAHARYVERALELIADPACPASARHIVLALLSTEAYAAWSQRTYGKMLPVTLTRLRQFSNVSHNELRLAIKWLRVASHERSKNVGECCRSR